MLNKMQFEEVLGQPDPKEYLGKLVDPRLGDSYPLDSVFKVVLPCLIKCKAKVENLLIKCEVGSF